MSEQPTNNETPIESSNPPEIANTEIVEDKELEALENQDLEEDSKEDSNESDKSKEAPKQNKAADKAAKDVGAKKIDSDTYKIKVDGEELELSREEVIKFAQQGRAGQKRMAEAAQIKKEAAELLQLLKSDPEVVLSDPAILGSSEEVIKFAQKILAKQLEEEVKSPEVKEKERLEKELEDLRRQMKEEAEMKQKAEYERLVADEEKKLDEEITAAIDSAGLPKSPFVLKRMADVLISAHEMGKEITTKSAINIVKREMLKDIKELMGVSPEEVLEDLIGSDRIKTLRRKQLAKVKAQQAETAAPSINQIKEGPKAEPKAEKPKKISMKDFLRGR